MKNSLPTQFLDKVVFREYPKYVSAVGFKLLHNQPTIELLKIYKRFKGHSLKT